MKIPFLKLLTLYYILINTNYFIPKKKQKRYLNSLEYLDCIVVL